MKKLLNNKSYLKWLIFMYIGGVALRYIIGLIASQNPFVMPDEALYANIARSIVNTDAISLRNQPITYTNILYPLLISPVYMLSGAGMQFRMIQLINCLVMNLAVFPAFGIARQLTDNKKTALGIAAVSLLLPDMLLTTRIMTEAIIYPLFLLTVYLMFGHFMKRWDKTSKAAITGLAAFLLTLAKSGSIALVVVFFGILLFDAVRTRRRDSFAYMLVFAGVFAALYLLTHLALMWSGMDFSWASIYQTQTQPPTLDHLKKTLPGLLLYAFFIPVAFGVYPLLMPASNLRRFDAPQKRQLILILLALVLYAAGACYLFFDTETVGSYFQGRIHIRYVFMFLPVLLGFAASPRLEDVKPNSKLLAALGFVFAMIVTVSLGALLSNRQYPVDAIMLSYIIYDDAVLNWRTLTQIAAITFMLGMLALIWQRGWSTIVKRICMICLVAGLIVANVLGYDLNSHNNTDALAIDSKEGAVLMSDKTALLVPETGIYFDNTLTVLDTAMTDAPYVMLYDDVCASLGDYGAVGSVIPPQYWTEKPVNALTGVSVVTFNSAAFSRFVLAEGTSVAHTQNGYYGIVSFGENKRLFHSALAGLTTNGIPEDNAVLYIYDETLLSHQTVRVYFMYNSSSAAQLRLYCDETSYDFNLDSNSEWIYADFAVPQGCTTLKVTLQTISGAPVIRTYSVE